MNRDEKALIHKDINEILSSRRVILPMTIVPIVLIVIIPLANYIENNSSMFTQIAPLIKNCLLNIKHILQPNF